MSFNVRGQGKSITIIEDWGNSNDIIVIKAVSTQDSHVFYTSIPISVSYENRNTALMVAEDLLENHHQSDNIGLGCYVNNGLNEAFGTKIGE